MKSIFSPHILIYKPQINSIFSLFLRFILILVFIDFFLHCLFFNLLSSFLFSNFFDLTYLTELIVVFYIIAALAEDFIDFDSIELNYWDIDLITFFNFFYYFCLLFLLLSISIFFIKSFSWSFLILH